MRESYRYDWLSRRNRGSEEVVGIVFAILVMVSLGIFVLWSCKSYRHDIGTIQAMYWERVIKLQYEDSHPVTYTDHKGNTQTRIEHEWKTRDEYRAVGPKAKPMAWPKSRAKRWGERVVREETFHYKIKGKIEGMLHAETGDHKIWTSYNIGDQVYVTLMWGKTVLTFKPYRMES
jgi:hypothetical protein